MRRYDQQVPAGEQLEPGDPLSFVLYTDNAASGENYGLEATLAWRPTASLLLDLRAALLETRYIGYVFNDRDLDGREQAHAPQYQYDLGIEYSHPRGWYGRVDLAGLDNFYFDVSHGAGGRQCRRTRESGAGHRRARGARTVPCPPDPSRRTPHRSR